MAYNLNFSQDVLYGDLSEEIISFLNADKCMSSVSTKSVLLEYISSTLKSKQFQLPVVGKEYHWLNTKRPLCLGDDLGRKVYAIDFFTYCCINCIHILPYLKEVEIQFAHNPGVAVIGIHSAKFSNEKNLDQVREAVQRNDIKHPVLNDPHCILWNTFGITCWPTVFIVGPDRVLLFILIGETQIEKLPELFDLVFNYIECSSLKLDNSFLPICEVTETKKFTELLYPANVSTNGEKILVSDTGHNRLILLSRDLNHKDIIGSGVIGCLDGPFETASFNSPHGTTWLGHLVYVADTGNHSIREVCFKCRTVITLFNERKVRMILEENDGENVKFQSPWDVCLGTELGSTENKLNVLYIAVAGSHQIWALYLDEPKSCKRCRPFAGSGREENRPNRFRFKSAFAQPSGITYNQNLMPNDIFVADSESSTIKAISLRNGAVRNIVGGGLDPTDLFKFGDKDGYKREVRLQHPMSVCVLDQNTLIIADTYNHKIKRVNVTENMCQSVAINEDLNEPGGICLLNNCLVIADTNNHRIMTILLSDIVSEFLPENYDLEVISENLSLEDDPQTILSVAPNGRVFCNFLISCNRYVLNEDSPQKCDISFKGNKLDVIYRSETFFGDKQPSLILKQVSNPDKDSGLCHSNEVILLCSIPVCDKQNNTCCYKKVLFKIIIDGSSSGAENIHLKFNLGDEFKLFQ